MRTSYGNLLKPRSSTLVPSQCHQKPNPCSIAIELLVCLSTGRMLKKSDTCTGYMNMTPPKYEQVVEDCDEALKLDANYVKALNRRANALEALERYEEALRGESVYYIVIQNA
jgi:tetratricopeptide (TPR) repeat protein